MKKKELKYNFVFLYAHDEFCRNCLGEELYHHPQVRVHRYAFESGKLLETLYHYHTAYSVNEKINLPFKSIWFKRMMDQGFENDLPVCFVYLGGNMVRFDGGFAEYVKRVDPRNKVVMIHWDLISRKIKYDYNIIRNRVDLAITYEKSEAEKYGIEYFEETVYSKLIPEPDNVTFEQDVYFLAAVKDRLPKIMDVYHYLSDNGIKCKFVLVGVPEDQQETGEGLEYSKGISYEDNLKNVFKSKCVLELIQGGSSDITMRALESIAYRRKLLTDCQIVNSNYFNEGQLFIFKNPEDINMEFLKENIDPDQFEPKIELDPMKRLYFIQEKLEALDEK